MNRRNAWIAIGILLTALVCAMTFAPREVTSVPVKQKNRMDTLKISMNSCDINDKRLQAQGAKPIAGSNIQGTDNLNEDGSKPWMPLDQADNPLIFRQFQIVIENTYTQPIDLYYWTRGVPFGGLQITGMPKPSETEDEYKLRNAFRVDYSIQRKDEEAVVLARDSLIGIRIAKVDINQVVRDKRIIPFPANHQVLLKFDPIDELAITSRLIAGSFIVSSIITFVEVNGATSHEIQIDPVQIKVTEDHILDFLRCGKLKAR